MNKTVVINDILSAHAPILVMPASSEGKQVGFLSDLVNFYRYTYWLSCEYDPMTSFPMVFAERVFGKGEDYDRILQFKHCEFEYEKDNIIIGKVLDKIASDNADSLLIIDSLELLNDKVFDSQLEFLLKKCPKNLKIVLVSKRFIDLNYNNLDVCPKLLTLPEAESTDFDFSLLGSEERNFLYDIAVCSHVEGRFCEEIYPGAKALLDAVSRNAPAFVMRAGTDRYRVSSHIREKIKAIDVNDEYLKRRYVAYLLSVDRLIVALDIALKNRFFDLLDEIVDKVIKEGKKVFGLSEYFRIHGDYSEADATSGQKKLLLAIARGAKRDVRKMVSYAEEIIITSERDSDLERAGYYIKFLAFLYAGQYRPALDFARNVLRERVVDERSAIDWCHVLCRLPEVVKKCDEEIDEEAFYRYEKLLLKKENVGEFWYAKVLQAFAEVYFEWGNYNKAIGYINKLKARLPFYIIPYRLMDFYFYAGDMKLAYETARQALSASKFHDIEADLTEVYLLLAKSCDYLNRREESIKYIDYAVNLSEGTSANKYTALGYKAIFSAKMGKAGYGKDLVAVYEKGVLGKVNKSEYMIYLALAYCSYCLGEYEDAEKYAQKCEQKAHAKSGSRVLSKAIELAVRLRDNAVEAMEVEELFSECNSYGMTVIVVNYYDIFEPLFEYARRSGMRLPSTVEMLRQVRKKMEEGDREKSVVIRLFGDSYVGVNGKEVRWKTKKEKELFLLYVWKGKEGLDRGYIIDCLWHDYLYESAVNNLKTTNFMVRKTLSDAGINYSMKYANGKYYFTVDATTDLETFLRYYAEYYEAAQPHERLEIARKMYALYNGGFCREISTPIFKEYREELLILLYQVYHKVARDLIESGELVLAIRIIQRLENANLAEEYRLQIAELKKMVKERKNEN